MSARKQRAILSVTHKEGLIELGHVLHQHGYDLLASGGTARELREGGLAVTDVSELTGQAEILGGRVKTLHPAIAAGILAPTAEDLQGTGFQAIDLVIVNLYDFAGARGRGEDEAGLVEAIDIGGPTLLRAAAKNFDRVTVVPDPSFYVALKEELSRTDGSTTRAFRQRMAGEVFKRTAAYDAQIVEGLFDEADGAVTEHPLRYGENPHQAAWWGVKGGGGLEKLGLSLHGGKELSYNNLIDLVAALKLGWDLPMGGCAILKHTNPCGVGRGETALTAFERALACDPVSAFGGIVAFRDAIDGEAAERLSGRFLEVLAAPAFSEDAREMLSRKKQLRWLSVDYDHFERATRGSEKRFGHLRLRQEEDAGFPELDRWRHAAGPAPDDLAIAAGRLAWKVAKHVKSNAIVLSDAGGTLGIGAGQMSRVDSCQLAVRKARDAGFTLDGVAAASDGFFPFADGLELLAEAGIRTIIQPGGSIRDEEVAAAAERLGVSLCLTGVRHFRH